jgi:hypothetical protein
MSGGRKRGTGDGGQEADIRATIIEIEIAIEIELLRFQFGIWF